jgi:hypothetical protein
MTSRLRVEFVAKTDRRDVHERIKAIGGGPPGLRWKYTQQDAITWTEDGTFLYYIVNQEGKEMDLIVATSRKSSKYLKTKADGEQPHSLLNLPECH